MSLFPSKHDLAVILNKNKPKQLPAGRLQACFKKALIVTVVTTPRNTPGFQGHMLEAQKSVKKKKRGGGGKCPCANDTHFQPDFRASWGSGLIAPVWSGKTRIKNSPKCLPDLEKEVGGKGQEAAGVRHALTGEWRGSLDPDAEMVLPPPHPVPGACEGRRAGNNAAPLRRFYTGPKVLSQPGGPKPPSYRVSWHPWSSWRLPKEPKAASGPEHGG